MTLDEIEALRRQRTTAIQKFLDDNAALFCTQSGECDFDDEDDYEHPQLEGPMVIEDWVLLMVERNLGAVENNHFAYSTYYPTHLGVHSLIGLLEMSRDRER